ncbi:hypothetical protein BVC80_9071g48 [Macleaya cordata]|uniref:Uncharacterized protein n=1 Tax=Macleaya cordata TaxID=56857 RepID=A0A200PU42_MACCD|nr:hypothetical protein BVC80_9071g48 [Macleaya cordata]
MFFSRHNNKEVIKFSSSTSSLKYQILKKPDAAKKDHHHHHQYQTSSSNKVLKPLPRTFSKNSQGSFKAAGIITTATTTSKMRAAATNIRRNTQSNTYDKEMPAASNNYSFDDEFSQVNNEQSSTPVWLKSILLEGDDHHHEGIKQGTERSFYVVEGMGVEKNNCGGHGDDHSNSFKVEAGNKEDDYWNDLYLDDDLWPVLAGEEQ